MNARRSSYKDSEAVWGGIVRGLRCEPITCRMRVASGAWPNRDVPSGVFGPMTAGTIATGFSLSGEYAVYFQYVATVISFSREITTWDCCVSRVLPVSGNCKKCLHRDSHLGLMRHISGKG